MVSKALRPATRSGLVVWLVMAATLAVAGSLFAAENAAAGRQIYRKLCVTCHGKNGEGVKGKHDDALAGNWSITKLAGVIEKTMPDDKPGTCTGSDAVNVARYIYDAFYSPEARAKHAKPRIELVRLTNRQYQNTVADLFRTFGPPDGSIEKRGLQAAYYNANRFAHDRKVKDQIDPVLMFDFGTNSAVPEKVAEGEFAIQWRGSLLAEETGSYELVLRTVNGTRIWLNDPDEPLIDAWVVSGASGEQRASIKLIGGRAYPLHVDYTKSKEKTASIALLWKPPHGPLQPIPNRCLTPVELAPTFVVATPFPADDSSVGYERGVGVSKAWDEAATFAAIEAANHAANHLDQFAGTKTDAADRAAKAKAFCQQFVERAFRRPLSSEQSKAYVEAFFKGDDKLETSVKRVILLALKSPRFLYLGLSGTRPDDFDVAARLAYGLWDSLPDVELIKLASAGNLRTRAAAQAQATRMLKDPRARAKMQSSLHHWLQIDHAEDLSKDTHLFPDFSLEIAADLRTSLDYFLDDVVWNERSDYRDLLLADYLFVNSRLARFYGLAPDAGDSFAKVGFDDGQRSGVLTHPYLLAAFSYHKSTSPIHRGVFLTRNIVGRSLKPPPMAVAFKDADFNPNMTMREKVAELTRPEACQGCHSVINPLGFSLEHFDAVGRFRKSDRDRPIDAASEYTTNEGRTIRLTGPRDVAQHAANSVQAQSAFVEHLFHQVVKQPALAYGAATLDEIRQRFGQSNFNVRQLLVDIASLSAVHGLETKNQP